MPSNNIYSVSELNLSVKDVLRKLSGPGVWVKGEILNYKAEESGRYATFLLCEKDTSSNRIVAQVQAMCWREDLKAINLQLSGIEEGLGLKSGISVQLQCQLDLWPAAGRFQVVVKNIEPAVTLGELHFSRQKIYSELKALGMHEKNQQLEIPLCPLRVALIASRQSAGYKDFVSELQSSGYPFNIDLYQASVQGEAVERDLTASLALIKKQACDVVAIVRGGGSITDLKWFDNKKIGLAIANCPFPVLTGIGHEIDLSVADMVAKEHFKTPTAVAAFLAERAAEYERGVDQLSTQIYIAANDIMRQNRAGLTTIIKSIEERSRSTIRESQTRLFFHAKEITSAVKNFISHNMEELKYTQDKLSLFDPANTIKLGYSIVRDANGKLLRKTSQIEIGQDIFTQLQDGNLLSKVSKKGVRYGKEANL